MSEIYHKLNEMDWTEVMSPKTGLPVGVKVKNIETANTIVRFQDIAFTGKDGISHAHAHEQLVYTISGQMRMMIEDEVYILGPGDFIAIPPWAKHTTHVLTEEGVKNVIVFAPKPE